MKSITSKTIPYITVLLLLFVTSCNKNHQKASSLETPTLCVVKLISAESIGDISAAETFLDVESTYQQFTKGTGKTPREVWEELVLFHSRIRGSIKLTNVFPFHKYTITETISDSKAVVMLSPIAKRNNSLDIVYNLELVNMHWIVKSKNIPI